MQCMLIFLDDESLLLGIVTEGDLRRSLAANIDIDNSLKGLLSTQAMQMLLERRPAMGSRHCWPCSSLVLCSV